MPKAAWKDNQQKETKSGSAESNKPAEAKFIKIRMLSNYRDVAKRGDVWKTDTEKAEELVKMGRAEYIN